MIGKNVALEDVVAKTHGQRMHNLLAYLDQVAKALPADKQPVVFHLGALDSATADAEMVALAEVNPRARLPMRHMIHSWPSDEYPTPEQARQVAEVLMRETGLEGCLCKCSLQYDTGNVHLHVAACTVDPVTLKMRKTAFIEEALHRSCAINEHIHGWRPEENTRYSVLEDGSLIKNIQSGDYELIRQKALHEKAARQERYTGQRSAQDIAQEEVGKILRDKKVATWGSFHARLAAVGLSYERVRSGAVIKVRQGDELVSVKASDADRKATLKALEKRFGAYQAANGIKVEQRAIEPAAGVKGSGKREKLWRTYQAQRAEAAAGRVSWKVLRERHAAERKKLAEQLKADRAVLRGGKDQFGQPVKRNRDVLNVQRMVLAGQHAKMRAELRERQGAERDAIRAHGRFPDFKVWLEEGGHDELAREHVFRIERPTIEGADQKATPHDIRAYQYELVGEALHYRRNGHVDFVDYGKRISFENWHDPVAMRSALQLSAEKWPAGFTLTGSMQFKEAAIKTAVEMGLGGKILNPELHGLVAEHQARIEKERAAEKGAKQSRQGQEQTRKERERERGRGR